MADRIFTTLGASNHTDKEREILDYYATDPIAIDKLLTTDTPYNRIWECACGGGHMAKRLKEHGFDVFSTDIIDRGYEDFNGIYDFLCPLVEKPIDGEYDIITNPPYKYSTEFVTRALEEVDKGHKVYMLLRLQFLESKGRYNEIFKDNPPKNVLVFIERCNCAQNGDFVKYQSNGAVAYAWFVWEKGYKGDTVVKWI